MAQLARHVSCVVVPVCGSSTRTGTRCCLTISDHGRANGAGRSVGQEMLSMVDRDEAGASYVGGGVLGTPLHLGMHDNGCRRS